MIIELRGFKQCVEDRPNAGDALRLSFYAHWPDILLSFGDIQFCDDGLSVHLRKSKTDQEG